MGSLFDDDDDDEGDEEDDDDDDDDDEEEGDEVDEVDKITGLCQRRLLVQQEHVHHEEEEEAEGGTNMSFDDGTPSEATTTTTNTSTSEVTLIELNPNDSHFLKLTYNPAGSRGGCRGGCRKVQKEAPTSLLRGRDASKRSRRGMDIRPQVQGLTHTPSSHPNPTLPLHSPYTDLSPYDYVDKEHTY